MELFAGALVVLILAVYVVIKDRKSAVEDANNRAAQAVARMEGTVREFMEKQQERGSELEALGVGLNTQLEHLKGKVEGLASHKALLETMAARPVRVEVVEVKVVDRRAPVRQRPSMIERAGLQGPTPTLKPPKLIRRRVRK